MRLRISLACFVLALPVGCASSPRTLIQRFAADGSIDTSLNSGVPLSRTVRGSGDLVRFNGLMALAIDAQDLIAVGLQEEGRYTSELLNFSGSPFPPFGGIQSAGFVVEPQRYYFPQDLAIARGEGVLGTGFVIAGTEIDNREERRRIALARFDIRGLDRTFGSSGRVILGRSDYEALHVSAVAFDDSGRILVAGAASRTVGSASAGLIVRFLSDGRLDTSFGSGGFVIEPVGRARVFHGLALDSRGRIVAAGRQGAAYEPWVARFAPDGSPDVTFGSEGAQTIEAVAAEVRLSRQTHLAIDAADRIVGTTTTQESTSRALVFRLTAAGNPDATFGSGGRVVVASPRGDGLGVVDIGLDASGRILICGSATADASLSDATRRLLVARLLSDGRLDPTFSGDGFALSDVAGSGARSMAITGNRVTVGGFVFPPR